MAQQATIMGPSAELRTWSASRFTASGTSAERLKAQAFAEFCGDGDWVRAFVEEKIEEEIQFAITGVRRVDAVKGPGQLSLLDAPGDSSVPVTPGPTLVPDTVEAGPDWSGDEFEAGRSRSSRRDIVEQANAEPAVPRWAKALAVNPQTRTFRPLLSLTREELMDGADYLGARAEVLRSIAGRMKPGQMVRDVMDEAELNRLIGGGTFRPLLAGKAG